jgi:hypothetical protein
MLNIFFFPENRVVYEIMWKNVVETDRPQRQYNMLHALCVLDTLGFRHTHGIRNVYCFSTANMFSRTRLYIRFIHTLPAFLYIRFYF